MLQTINDKLKPLLGGVKLDPRLGLGLMAGLAGLLALAVVFYLWRDQGAMRSLYGAGEAYPAADVMQVLDADKIAYQLHPQSGQILVREADLGRARMLLSAKGVQVAVPAGYDLFDKDEPLGTSQFVQDVRLKRSLEGELARTIMALKGIDNARVHLALQESSSFVVSNSEPAKASVMLQMSPGAKLTPEQVALLLGMPAHTAPLMDLVDIEGIRSNQVIGYGLVVGLDGSGDKNQVKFTNQSVANLIKQFGINLPPNVDPKLKNVAAVTVTASIPASYSPGQSLDVTVSSLGDAKSLRGGQLLLTPLMGVDGEVYALAQGAVVVGGVKASGRSGSSVSVNSSNSGLIPNGATVERMIPSDFNERSDVMLNLRKPSFQTASRVAEAVNARFGAGSATALNGTKVSVTAPIATSQRVSYMAILESLDVQEGRTRPKVVFNSRTGTVVVGQGVRVKAAAVAHGTLTVTISETPQVSQPGAFSGGQTAVVPRSDIDVSQQRNPMFAWPDGADLDSIIKTVNSLGATPDDVMSILQALEQAGALNAELIVI